MPNIAFMEEIIKASALICQKSLRCYKVPIKSNYCINIAFVL